MSNNNTVNMHGKPATTEHRKAFKSIIVVKTDFTAGNELQGHKVKNWKIKILRQLVEVPGL
jgi:hypothetical protein